MVPLIESFLMNTFIDSSLVDIGPVVLEKSHNKGDNNYDGDRQTTDNLS